MVIRYFDAHQTTTIHLFDDFVSRVRGIGVEKDSIRVLDRSNWPWSMIALMLMHGTRLAHTLHAERATPTILSYLADPRLRPRSNRTLHVAGVQLVGKSGRQVDAHKELRARIRHWMASQ